MMIITSSSSEETEIIGEKLGKKLTGNEIICFYGDLGVGKTTFIRGLARNINCEDLVSSPTFTILHEYNNNNKFKIFHFDMYRVTSFDDLESTGFFDFINTGVILIEWAENIEHELNNLKNIIKINIQKKVGQNFENTRIIEIQGVDNL
ncbi:MAG: tRNA (adenosine(37)-N6)-threonylcarbamoyltransferase complex ATPase subunit type 1 TsaE [Clostridia bacterium]|nr:tRNA (adenosine(37)-N6)-threonylcarbamoyltransferase complex ATPase subunit type 1 TsaE [Clostridia bacterium]MBQ3092991.1 tRNA (adenosine(37)-N6)-threonylcarbamoyltransferase complex ATPase subunit type 1 TsaE [Clostridia bacterium]